MYFKQHTSFNRGKLQSSLLMCEVWGKLGVFTKRTKNKQTKKTHRSHLFHGANHALYWVMNSRITLAFLKNSRRTDVNFGLNHVTRFNPLPSPNKIAPLWHVAEGRKSYSQQTSKSMTESRCWIRQEKRIFSSIIKCAQSRECNILFLQRSLSNYAKFNQL